MPLTRRRFLKAGTLSTLVAGSALAPLRAFGLESAGTNPTHASQTPFGAGLNPDLFTRGTFEPLVGSSFRSERDGGSVNLKLLRVNGYDPAARTKLATEAARPTESFTLTFRAGRALPAKTSTHQLEHADLGKFDLFMTPYVSPRGHVYYEAVFNRVA